MSSAKELCAMLITRSLKGLSEEEEEIVVDYLENIGIEVDLDMTPRDMCIVLLEKTMEKELNRRVPMTAYANSLISKGKAEKENIDKRKIDRKRQEEQRRLQKKFRDLPGCAVASFSEFSNKQYQFIVDPNLGIEKLNDGTQQYTAKISVPKKMYKILFLEFDKPIIELNNISGYKAYAKIDEPHSNMNNVIYISPLVGTILNSSEKDRGFIKICGSLPEIKKVNFTFYGTRGELNELLALLINKLSSVINAFSYLSLGMILITDIQGKEVRVRVDGLYDMADNPIFAGILPFSETDIPFEIKPDI